MERLWDQHFHQDHGNIVAMASDGDSVRRKVLFEEGGEKESDPADHLPLQDNTPIATAEFDRCWI